MGGLTPAAIISVITVYFLVLIGISIFTSRNADNKTFFSANKNSSWLLVAIGMIGASLSGVTFISIPGMIGKAEGANVNFSYMQMVFGYLVGYFVIATVLLPLYYRLNLVSIYEYLEHRFGFFSYKTGAAYFLLSRVIGASFRLYLVALVLDAFVTGPLGLPFMLTVLITIVLIWIYTAKGGIKTIVVTDTFQTVSMLTAVVLTIVGINQALDLDFSGMMDAINAKGYSRIFYFDNGWNDANNFFKQFLGGALIAITMTGMDQDMMQKNLTCRSLKDAQKNVFTFSVILIFANLLFLTLGAMLYVFAAEKGLAIPGKADLLYPTVALEYLPASVGIAFILGLIAAAYSSADSALTSLTTSFCVDFLGLKEQGNSRTRYLVHVGFSLLLLLVIYVFHDVSDDSVINSIFKAANYTYGPILGLFTFGLATKYAVKDRWVILVCLLAPVLCFVLDFFSNSWFGGFQFGNLILLLNGLITFIGLYLIKRRKA